MAPTPTIRGHQAQGSRNETAGTDQRTAQEAFALQSVLNADGPTDSRHVLGSGTQQSAVRLGQRFVRQGMLDSAGLHASVESTAVAPSC